MVQVNSATSDAEVFVQEVDNFLQFTGAEPPKPNSIFILVMGVTGSGKSTFISKCSGKPVEIGHDLQSCTEDLSIVSFQHPDNIHTVYLIDTPGFDDTNRTDTEILTHIAQYLSVSYANRIYISGVIYMHRISDVRMAGSARKNINMFKQLVGEEAYENVAIATTMWWKGEEAQNERKEKQLAEDDFRDVLGAGAKMFRCTGGPNDPDDGVTKEQALEILNHLIGKSKEGPVVLKIQNEMVDERVALNQTLAGRAVEGNMTTTQSELRAQLQETKRELAEALRQKNTRAASEFQEAQADLEKKDQSMDKDRGKLDKKLIEMYQQEEGRLFEKIEKMENQWQAATRKKVEELQQVEQELAKLKAAAELEAERQKHNREMEQHRQQAYMAAEENRQRQRDDYDRWSRAEDARRRQEDELRRMRKEMEELQQSTAKKQKATDKVKDSFRNSTLSSVAEGVATGLGSIAISALAAGMFCNVM